MSVSPVQRKTGLFKAVRETIVNGKTLAIKSKLVAFIVVSLGTSLQDVLGSF